MARISEKLQATRRARMVGRAEELARCHALLKQDNLLFLYFYGPGGIGKTTLLEAFRQDCLAQKIAVCHVEGRHIDATPEAFLEAVGTIPVGRPSVLLVDTFERLKPLEGWLREAYLPQLPEETRIVFCGRHPLEDEWRSDSGWQSLHQAVPVSNLTQEETCSYLTTQSVSEKHHANVFAFTRGYPLALSLATEVLAGERGREGDFPVASPNLIAVLLQRILDDVPDLSHREALEICSLLRVTTESSLGALLPTLSAPEIHALFGWLQERSFIQKSGLGLFPHDLAREAIISDLRWRHPERCALLNRQVRDYFVERFEVSTSQEQQQLIEDYIFLHQDNPVIRATFTWEDENRTFAEIARPSDIPLMRQMVERHEGEESARLFSFWAGHPAHHSLVFRKNRGEVAGFVSFLNLTKVGAAERLHDPAVHHALHHLEEQDFALEPGETVIFFRFWMAADTYHSVSPVQSQIVVQCVRYYLMTQNLAYSFFPCSQPDFWLLAFTYADIHRLPNADFTVGDRTYGVYGHDWRKTPVLEWLTLLGAREESLGPLQFTTQGRDMGSIPPSLGYRLIREEDFEKALRDALKNLTDPDEFFGNLLLESRLITKAVGENAHWQERAAYLQSLISEAIASLENHPRQSRAYRALYRTFVHPAPTQEKAAEILDLPFSTYRRHLGEGIEHITRVLWREENEPRPK